MQCGQLKDLGFELAIIAASFGLDGEDDLAQILPEPDSDESLPTAERANPGRHSCRQAAPDP